MWGWMDGYMDGYINGSMDGRIVVRSMEWQVDKWMDGMTRPKKRDCENKMTALEIIIISLRKITSS